jgi:hypothetical protein
LNFTTLSEDFFYLPLCYLVLLSLRETLFPSFDFYEYFIAHLGLYIDFGGIKLCNITAQCHTMTVVIIYLNSTSYVPCNVR